MKVEVVDLVRYLESPEVYRLGFVTDVFEDYAMGYPMYEVIATSPYERGWFMDTQLEVINESR